MEKNSIAEWLLAATLMIAVGCGKADAPKAPAPGSSPTPATDKATAELPGGELRGQAQAAADRAKALGDTESPALTIEQYERLLLDLQTCTLTESGAIEHTCPALKAFDQSRNAKTSLKDLAGMSGTLGRKHLAHASPAVRIKAVSLMHSVFGADPGTQQLILTAIAKEAEPGVLRAMLDTVGTKGLSNPEIGKMLLAQVNHPSPIVRKAALTWLASSWNNGLPGGIEALIAKMEADPDPEVRESACGSAGKLGDDRLVPVYEKLTKDPADRRIYTACMKGLLEMWLSYPFFETGSEKAYRLTLKRLGEKPRSEVRPPWSMMGNFKHAGAQTDKVKAWRAKATWYKQDKLVAAIVEVVADPAATWLARAGGIDSLSGLGVPKATFAKLLKSCGDGCDQNVKRKLDEALAKAP